MPGFGHHRGFAVWNIPAEQPQQRRRQNEIGVAGDEQRRDFHSLQRRPGDLVRRLLPDPIAAERLAVKLEPEPDSLGIDRTIRGGQLAELDRHVVEAFGTDIGEQLHVIGVAHPAAALREAGPVREHHAQKSFRMGESIVNGDSNAAGGCDDVEFLDAEKLEQMAQILRPDPGIVLGHRIGIVVAPARIRDDPIAGGGEDRLLVAPDQRTAGGRMQKDDSRPVATRVGVPEPRIRKLREPFLCGNRHRHRVDHIAIRRLQLGGTCCTGDAGQDAAEKQASTAEAIVARAHSVSPWIRLGSTPRCARTSEGQAPASRRAARSNSTPP